MSRHERRYQRYLERHKKQGTTAASNSAGGARASAQEAASAAVGPIQESLVPANLFEQGIGNLLFSRAMPDGRIAVAGFLLDLYCLGVKNAFLYIMTRAEYAEAMRNWTAAQKMRPMGSACLRKLVEGGVAYARELGFSPHADYAEASRIFGDVESTACSTFFEYGRDGKPCYISGPHETPAQVHSIIEQLKRRLGPGNFDYLVLAEPTGEF
jgi:hypothetical protein